MSATTRLETIKRKICEADVSFHAPKRARTIKPFYKSHLTMLQSLCENDHVHENTWNAVKLFLQNKSVLLKHKKKQEHLRGIHQQAVKHVQHQSAAQPHTPTYATPQQLHSPSMFSPLGMSQATTTDRPRCSFAIVVRLLGLQADAAQQDSRFSSLLADTNARIEQLEATLKTLKLKRREEDRKKMKSLLSGSSANENINDADANGVSNDNVIIETETKIQLWKMLAHELTQVQ